MPVAVRCGRRRRSLKHRFRYLDDIRASGEAVFAWCKMSQGIFQDVIRKPISDPLKGRERDALDNICLTR